MILLDTMVVSEAGKRNAHPGVESWLRGLEQKSVFVSVSAVTFGEIAGGVVRAYALDKGFGRRLELWSASTRKRFAEQTLAITTEVAAKWGELCVRLGRRDVDLFIAATALQHDLTVATRNTRHFERTGVRLINPYEF